MGLPPVACRELPDTANHDARYQHRRGPVEDIIIAEGDKVVIRRTCTGTHHDTFRSIAPAGNRWRFRVEHPPLLLVFLPEPSKIAATGRA
jgi:hypothetical protein